MKEISIIIVTYNSEDHIFYCIDSILSNNDIGDRLEIIVVDNNSLNADVLSLSLKSKFKDKVLFVRNKENAGYGQGNNVGIDVAKGEIILIMNPDVRLIKPIFKKAINIFENPDVALLGMTQKLGSNKKGLSFYSIVPSYPILNSLETVLRNKFSLYNSSRMCIAGACFFLNKRIFEQINKFDEKLFMYGEENDVHHRLLSLHKGIQIKFCSEMEYVHLMEDRYLDIVVYERMLNSAIYFCEKNALSVESLLNREIVQTKFWIVVSKLRCNDINYIHYKKWLKKLVQIKHEYVK